MFNLVYYFLIRFDSKRKVSENTKEEVAKKEKKKSRLDTEITVPFIYYIYITFIYLYLFLFSR